MSEIKLPTLQELYSDVEVTKKEDVFMALMNAEPAKTWVKVHPFIKNYNYLPIDKIEFLLKKIFKTYKIEVIKTGLLFNAIEVHVRVHYKHPVTGEMLFHDGVGAQELQTQQMSGTLKMDMSNVNKGAVTMALPIAKTIAIKDACDHFGKLFGSDLNRKDTLTYSTDEKLQTINVNFEQIKKQIS
jgi:hypothetical protein